MSWSDEDEAYVATVPEFPHLSGLGETAPQAVEEVLAAVALALEVLAERGTPAPEPQKAVAYSGQFRVRLPRSLHKRLAEEADAEGVSLNTLIVSRLSGPGRLLPAAPPVRHLAVVPGGAGTQFARAKAA